MITLECADIKGIFECASFTIQDGNICLITTETDLEKNLLLRVLTGLTRVESGKVLIFGRDLSTASYIELNETRKRIGVVLNTGGLVSNLKVWENAALPAAYHASLSDLELGKKVSDIFERIGYETEDLNMLPGLLPAYKKRLAGLARAMLMEPDIMIYDSVFEGLKSDIKANVVKAVIEFHKEKNGRISVFLDLGKGLPDDVRTDNSLMLKKGKFHEGN